jgi:excisionase family DNA binding protein
MQTAPRQRFSHALSVKQFAALTGVSISTVNRAIGRGEIPCYTVGSVRRVPAWFLEQLQRCEVR